MPNVLSPSIPTRTSRAAALILAAGLTAGVGAASAQAQAGTGHLAEFPTVDRVLYVQECMRAHPGPHYEMVNKCACALERLAGELSFDDYVSLSTAANATSIGGERGGVIRDSEALQADVRRYRTLQAKVKKSCFITP
ncbi:MAG TPA: hypothetical protein PLW24_18895 [Burkholderiaceae bacterium]|nr:hypothetical protein [Burkholderiaceae bacterium]HNB46125.1 hypothetical protein [Burkholderiaceae bacterium]HNG81547.1 hypothetical protein [Burkholderiaceae bacterium]